MVNIYVLIKQVPKTLTPQIDRKTGAIIREGIEAIINPDDLYGLELALELKERYGGKTTAITMGPSQSEIALRECLAMGIDEALLVSDRQFAYSDTLQTTLVLKEVFGKLNDYDIIITGSETSDSSTGQVPYQLSEALDIPLITHIFSLEIEDHNFKCHRNFGHESQNIETKLPVLIRTIRHSNKPRHIPLQGIQNSFEKEIKVINFDDIGCPDYICGTKSPTAVIATEKIVHKRKNEFIEGNNNEKISKIIEIMRERGVEKIWTGVNTHE